MRGWILLLGVVVGCAGVATPVREAVPPATAWEWVDLLSRVEIPISEEELMEVCEFLADDAMQGRKAGSDHEVDAARYIQEQMRQRGLKGVGEEIPTLQRFLLSRGGGIARDGVKEDANTLFSQNVIGFLAANRDVVRSEVRDPPQHLVIAAHYDHLGVAPDGDVFNGADDNASGVAAMLALASALQKIPLQHPEIARNYDLLFIAFGAEEAGLAGSQWYVDQPLLPIENLRGIVNLDMLGRGKLLDFPELSLLKRSMQWPAEPTVGLLTSNSPDLALPEMRQLFSASGVTPFAPDDFPILGELIRSAAEGRDDSAPFRARGVCSWFFSTSEHPDYHKPSDTVATLDIKNFCQIAHALCRFMLFLQNAK